MYSSEKQDYWVNETIALLTFSLIKGIGYWTIYNLALKEVGLKNVLKSNDTEEFINYIKQAGCKNVNQISDVWENSITELWKDAVNLYRDLKNLNIEVIHYGQKEFPQNLKNINEAPRWLFVQGNISLLHRKAIAIVGTRKPSEDGRFLAKYIGSCLPYWEKIVTISGLAYGIDQIIHQQSMRFDVPTIAFLGTGILLNYPNNSEEIRKEILKKDGAIVSEYLPLDSYSAENFVRRNRLQAGLAHLVIPVEWKPKSGTAHTVRYASQNCRQLISLKLPDWLNSEHPELSMAHKMGAKVFVIPGEGQDMIKAIEKYLNGESKTYKNLEDSKTEKIQSQPQTEYKQLNLWEW